MVNLQNVKKQYHFLQAICACLYYRFPARRMIVIGITGTDGKTTTASLIYWILRKAGVKVGLVSTVGAKIGDETYDTGLHVTSPEPFALQRLLRKMVNEGCKYAVLEVTSHGLDQHRVWGINFSISVLTNITREHLDYHMTYANYVEAKARLFRNSKICVFNKDDKSYKFVRKLIDKPVRVIDYTRDILKGDMKRVVLSRFAEPYNQSNAAAAITVTRNLGLDEDVIRETIISFPGISGRLEEIQNKRGVKIYVDFAHTPNALKEVLSFLRLRVKRGGKLIVVFGCAGERDRQKRPKMARVSTSLADYSVFTAEDPRGEDVNDILAQMERGAVDKNYVSIADRKEAIRYAIMKLAKRSDTIVICGKGHERSMAFGKKEYAWSDQETVGEVLCQF